MKTRIPLTVIALLAVFLAMQIVPLSKAHGGEPFEPIHSEALIEKCWALSKEDRDSGVTGRMRSGSARTARCLQDVIVEQAAEMFEPNTLSRQEVRDKLRKISEGYQTLYWSIYNEHKRCGVECGTDRQVYHLGAYTALLEDIIRDMVKERNEMRF